VIRAARLLGLGMLLAASLALAQEPGQAPPSSPQFEIKRFAVEGNTLVPADEIAARLAPFVGARKTFADVQLAQDALQGAYRDKGYGAVQVLLPEQELTDGVVRLRVIEGKIGKIEIQGTQFHDEQNIRQSVPALKEGETPNLARIAENLSIANENPTKRTTVTLRASEQENQVDAVVGVEDSKPLRFYLSVDNTGDRQSGQARVGVGFQQANLWNRDDVLTAQYVTAPANVSEVTLVGAGYHMPLYDWNGSVDLIAGYSNVDSGTVQNLFAATGKGYLFLARYNYYLRRLGEGYEQRLTAGLDYRAYQNNVELTGTGVNLVPDYTVHPVSLAYSGIWHGAETNGNLYAALSQNIPGGNDGSSSDFPNNAFGGRPGATDHYTILRAGLQGTLNVHPVGVQARAAFNAQYTGDALVAAEQFGLGGMDSVRGFITRIIANDRGYQGQLELYAPDLGKPIGIDGLFLRPLAFFDFGYLARNKALPSDAQLGVTSEWLSSAGVGIQGGFRGLSFRLYYADPINQSFVQSNGIQRWQGSLVYIF
jgi:hemolysin activation/secretion protein